MKACIIIALLGLASAARYPMEFGVGGYAELAQAAPAELPAELGGKAVAKATAPVVAPVKAAPAIPAKGTATTGKQADNGGLHFFEFDNAKMIWKNNWDGYRNERENMNTCKLAESDNWKGAQQCKFLWECRGARTCERGGWCEGFDGCEETPFP